MNIGDKVYIPRFCTVTIDHVFDSVKEARAEGFTEPTYYDKAPGFKVLGRSIGVNRMDFCAARISLTDN